MSRINEVINLINNGNFQDVELEELHDELEALETAEENELYQD